MSANDRPQEESSFRNPPTGPRIAPPSDAPRATAAPRPQQPRTRKYSFPFWSVVIFLLLMSSVAIRAYRDLSQPEAWAYWKDQFVSPSLSSTPFGDAGGSDRSRRGLVISGEIGPAAAIWFRARLDEAKLVPGDMILLSSPGGNLDQAMIMGEEIRARGLVTAVGVVDASGRIRPAFCASACVLVYSGGKVRYGVEGSRLGVHRFVSEGPMRDPVADTQRVAGIILGYMTKMGVSASIVEAMSQTRDIRWLNANQAVAMNLVTEPFGRP